MSRRCPISGKAVQSGNLVSHSNHKTRCRFKPNLQKITFISDVLGESFQMRVSTRAIRTVDINGGIDSFLLSTPRRQLTGELYALKKRISAKLSVAKQA